MYELWWYTHVCWAALWCIPCYWQVHTAAAPCPLSFYLKTSCEYCKTESLERNSYKKKKHSSCSIIKASQKSLNGSISQLTVFNVNGDKVQVNYRDEMKGKVEEWQKRGKERRSGGRCRLTLWLEFRWWLVCVRFSLLHWNLPVLCHLQL